MPKSPTVLLTIQFVVNGETISRNFTFRAWLPALERRQDYDDALRRAYDDWTNSIIDELLNEYLVKNSDVKLVERSMEWDPATPGAYLMKLKKESIDD